MRITFSTPLTPTRDRLTCVEGRRAWTSAPVVVSRRSVMRTHDTWRLRAHVSYAVVPRYTRRGSTPLGSPPIKQAQPFAAYAATHITTVTKAGRGDASPRLRNGVPRSEGER